MPILLVLLLAACAGHNRPQWQGAPTYSYTPNGYDVTVAVKPLTPTSYEFVSAYTAMLAVETEPVKGYLNLKTAAEAAARETCGSKTEILDPVFMGPIELFGRFSC